jgi:hypothetical protein
MFKHTRVFPLFLVLILVALALPAQAQDLAPIVPMAVVREGSIYTDMYGDFIVEVAAEGTYKYYDNLTWSPDGNTLAFTGWGLRGKTVLLISDRQGSPPVPLASGLSSMLPFHFSDDGSRIIYASQTEEIVEMPAYGWPAPMFHIYGVAPQAGAEPELLGKFVFLVGCGGGSNYPSDWRYWDEAGFEANGLVFALTPYGVVHSILCNGYGLALSDPQTGEPVVLDNNFARGQVSPDRTQVLGILDGTLVLVDLATQTITPLLAATDVPDQVAWGAPNTRDVFYSTRDVTDQSLVSSDADLQAIADSLNYTSTDYLDLPVMHVTIHRFNLDTEIDTVIYEADAYAIGRMIPTPEGSALLFSQVPNMQAWVQAILEEGSVSQDRAKELIQTVLYYLDLSTGDLSWYGPEMNKASLNVTAYWEQG